MHSMHRPCSSLQAPLRYSCSCSLLPPRSPLVVATAAVACFGRDRTRDRPPPPPLRCVKSASPSSPCCAFTHVAAGLPTQSRLCLYSDMLRAVATAPRLLPPPAPAQAPAQAPARRLRRLPAACCLLPAACRRCFAYAAAAAASASLASLPLRLRCHGPAPHSALRPRRVATAV